MTYISNNKKLKDINILFLAHYAPKDEYETISHSIHDKVYAEYHHEIFHVLKKHFPCILSTSNTDILLKKNINVDYIFSLYNRMNFRNSEIFISTVAEYKKIPYLGSPPNIRALAEDKHLSKMLAYRLNVPTPKWNIYNVNSSVCRPNFKGPYFVKPRFGAASKFIDEDSICSSWEKAKNRIRFLHEHNIDAILEEQIDGIYHTSPVLRNFGKPLLLPVIEQLSNHKGNVVTYHQKRKIESGLNRNIVKNNAIQNQIQYFSKLLFSQVQPLDYTRFDYIIDRKSNIPYFLEFNVCCNLGSQSTIYQSAQSLGITYEDLVMSILYSSLFRQGLIKSTMGNQL